MTNREWLNSMSDEEFARMFDGAWGCYRCSYNEGGACGRPHDDSCMDGIIKWLKAKNEKPMPEIKAGDIIYYCRDNERCRAVCVYGNIVLRIDKGGCINYGGEIKENTIAIRRYSIETGTVEDVWRSCNG